MPETEPQLDFSLPNRSGSGTSNGATGGGKWTPFLLLAILLLAGANLALLLLRDRNSGSGKSGVSEVSGVSQWGTLPKDDQRALALKLEEQGLHKAATQAWSHYLIVAKPEREDASAIWYRIGKLHQDGGQFEQALAAYYRCEALDPNTGLKDEIGRRAQESLEAMGKFSALKHELASRVSLDESAGNQSSEVLAEIGARKITRSEVDRQIEANIENQLVRFAARMPEAQRKQQKEAMLKQFSSDSQRMQFLQSFIVQELLNRKARETSLLDDPSVRAQLQDLERGFLAQQMMTAEVASKVHISDVDLTTHFEANKSDYVEPESAAISHIVVEDRTAAVALIEELMQAENLAEAFAVKAREVSTDTATRENGGELAAPLRKGAAASAGLAAVFATEAGQLLVDPVPQGADDGPHRVVLVRQRVPERQRAFQEVREQVYQELRSRKERELEQELLDGLRDEYDVVIHQSKFKLTPEEGDTKGGQP